MKPNHWQAIALSRGQTAGRSGSAPPGRNGTGFPDPFPQPRRTGELRLFRRLFQRAGRYSRRADNQSLLSFQVADSSAVLVLHYHIIDEKENEQELTFTPNTSTQFNHYEHDRSGTAPEPFPPGRRKSLPPNWITGVFCLADWDGMPAWNFLISIISLCRESR